jgi:putative thioredoxin
MGETEKAQEVLDSLPEEISSDPAFAQAKSALELLADKPEGEELAGLRAAADAAPDDMDAQLAFANGAFAAGARDEAADKLLAMIEADPTWNEGAAKAKLLQIFEAVGMEDPWVSATRRKLSLILFG